MYEADAQGQPLPTAAAGPVTMTLSGSGPSYQITLTPDMSWLQASGRRFPVAIDPTLDRAGY